MKLILASKSPRRKELFCDLVGADFAVIPAVGEEISNAKGSCELAMDLSLHKAQEVYTNNPDCFVVGCDTIVVHNGVVFGKPKDENDAVEMLSKLSNSTHFVYTGVTLMSAEETFSFAEETAVVFRELSAEEIKDYVATGSPMDKSGSYGIQDRDFVKSFIGSKTNVMGLPTERLANELHKRGIKTKLPI